MPATAHFRHAAPRIRSRAIALLAMALVAACLGQVPTGQPLSQVFVSGLTDSAGVKVVLINSTGGDCHQSAVVTIAQTPYGDDPNAEPAYKAAGLKGLTLGRILDKWKPPSKLYLVDFSGAKVQPKRECWCKDADDAGIAVLAPGKAVGYVRNRAIGSGYRFCPLPPVNPEDADKFTIRMRGKRTVEVRVWAESKEMLSMARDDIANTDWIYEKEVAGITLRPAFSIVPSTGEKATPIKQRLARCYPTDDQVTCCNQAFESSIFDSNAINVYYGAGSENFTCEELPAIFIHDVPILGDLAHEISHALGLYQSDNESVLYPKGHTREKGKFDFDNVMWDQTHFLKNRLTPAQVFWMSQSCGSFIASAGACLFCTETPDTASPCPAFSTGLEPDPKLSDLAEIVPPAGTLFGRHLRSSDSCDQAKSTYRDGGKLEEQLSARYRSLTQYAKGKPDLSLGSTNKGDFLKRWEPFFALNLSGIPQAPPTLAHRSDIRDALEKIRLGHRDQVPACLVPNRLPTPH